MDPKSLLSSLVLGGTHPTRGAFQQPPNLWHIIGGQRVDGDTFVEIYDPHAPIVNWQMPNAKPALVEQAIEHVAQFPCGADNVWTIEQRGNTFARAAQLITERWELLRAAITLCFPKSDVEAEGELTLMRRHAAGMSAVRIRTLIGYLDGGPAIGYEGTTHTDFLPWGPVSGVWPFNYPGEISFLQVIDALACGNVIVTKPHEYASPVEIMLWDLLVEAGMPPHLWSIVHGYGPDTSALVTDHRIQHSVFTGSSRVAKLLGGVRPDLQVEQSGLNWIWFEPPWHGADVVKATAGAATSAFGLGGQRCSCCRFIFAPATWGPEAFMQALREHSQQYRFGDRSLPVLMSWTTENLLASFGELESIGAKRAFGGEPVAGYNWRKPKGAPADRFNFGAVHPTAFTLDPHVLADPNPVIQRVLRTERFAPSVVVVFWNDEAERQLCINFINSLEERLTCGIGTHTHAATVAKLRREVRFNGVTNVGPVPWTTGAEDFKMFGPISGNGACIGGSDHHIRRVWLATFGLHNRF